MSLSGKQGGYVRIENLGEFALIQRLAQLLPAPGEEVVKGIGDDAAAIRLDGGQMLILTTDMLIEGVHFDLSFTSPRDIGYKTLAVNLSDLASMGCGPGYALVSLGLPDGFDVEEAEEIYRGLAECAERWGGQFVGGDTVSSPHGLTINLALSALMNEETMVTRAGARVGDMVLVTGSLGESALGLELFKRGIVPEDENAIACVQRHLRPEPRFAVGAAARAAGATAMIDCSDGLLADLGHICEASGTGAVVEADWLPISDAARRVAARLEIDPLKAALAGGEDYELIITVEADKAEEAASRLNLTPVGTIVIDSEGLKVADEAGVAIPVGTLGYEHFREGS